VAFKAGLKAIAKFLHLSMNRCPKLLTVKDRKTLFLAGIVQQPPRPTAIKTYPKPF